jgi:hypothetical protein
MCECSQHAIARWKRVSRRNTDWRDTRQSRWRHACRECGRPGDLLQPQRASRPSYQGRQKYWIACVTASSSP